MKVKVMETDWEARCRTVHGMTYDYVIPVGASSTTEITISCKIHGNFTQKLSTHVYRKCGCPTCANETRTSKKRRDLNYFRSKATEVHGGEYQYPAWTVIDFSVFNYSDKVEIVCPVHGKFLQSMRNHLQGVGCPACGKINRSTNTRKSTSYFIEKAIKVHGNKYDYSLVTPHDNSSTDTVTIVCSTHGKFEQTWASHVDKKAGCKLCGISSRKMTSLTRYGVEHKSQIHLSVDTIRRLNNKDWLETQHIKEKRTLEDIATELNVQDTTVGRYFQSHGIKVTRFPVSVAEKQIGEFLESNNIQYIRNDRELLKPQELDIFIPSHNIAIEHCGLYWHSENFKGTTYHQQKMLECKKRNIRLLTIYSDEWTHSREIIQNKILHLLNMSPQQTVYARNTTAVPLTVPQKNDFFTTTHIQGSGPGSISYGLQYKGVTIAAITFIRKKNNEYVLNRYSTNCNVVGGFSKLLSWFKSNHQWTKITTFADLRWSGGDLYDKCGFTQDKILSPDYSYIVNGKHIHKFNFRRKFLPSKLTKFDPSLSERENCEQEGLSRIWDCGKIRFVMINTT